MRLFRLAIAGAAAMMASAVALAQDDGPIVVGERPQLEGFRLTNLRAALEFVARYSSDSVRGPDSERRNEREIELRETLEIAAGAFVGHPGLVEFELLGRFTPAQRRTSRDAQQIPGLTGSEWTFEILGEYDARALIFQQSETPLTLHSRRNQTVISRQFGESFDLTAMEHGAQIDLRSGPVPGRVRYIRREQDTRSRTSVLEPGGVLGTRIADFKFLQDSFQWQGQFRPDPNQHLDWAYNFDSVQQIGPGTLRRSFRRHDAFITHSLNFGRDQEHTLRSTLHMFDESGAFDVRRLRLTERLRMRHTSRFETRYNYSFDWTQRLGVTQTIHRGSAGFRHRLFDSLVTSGDVGASHLTLGDFTSTNIFGNLSANYTKQVPYGRLGAAASINMSRQIDGDRNGEIQIIQEPHTFTPIGLITLQRRLIIAQSIVVTDAAGVVIYSPGLDYVVFDFIERVEIRRVIGGGIGEEETVLVSYRVAVETGNTTDTIGFRVSVRYDINEGPLRGVGIFARYFQQDQTRTNELELLLPPADVREVVFGADYTVGRLTFRGERQIHQSTISPFRATRLEATYVHPLGSRGSLLAHVTYLDLNRHEQAMRTEILTVGGRWNQQLTDELHMGLAASWRDDRNGSPAGASRVQAFEQRLDLVWRHRQTTIYGSARNALVMGDVRRGHFQTFFLGLRREF
jgi:hypothetical protein